MTNVNRRREAGVKRRVSDWPLDGEYETRRDDDGGGGGGRRTREDTLVLCSCSIFAARQNRDLVNPSTPRVESPIRRGPHDASNAALAGATTEASRERLVNDIGRMASWVRDKIAGEPWEESFFVGG